MIMRQWFLFGFIQVKLSELSIVLFKKLQSLLSFAETFILHITDEENEFENTEKYIRCHHGANQDRCKIFTQEAPCPTEDSIKYKMTRFAMESVNIFVVEAECACNIQVCLEFFPKNRRRKI